MRTVFDAGADDELWFDDDEWERLLSRTTAAARLWRALVAAGWSPHARNAAGETPRDMLRRAREHAAMLTERSPSRDLEERLAALNLWDALLVETVPGTEPHPAALAADAAVAKRKEEAYHNFLAELFVSAASSPATHHSC